MKNITITKILLTLSFLLIAPTLSAVTAPAKQKEFTVVIDAGHGGHDHGAVDNNAREKDINLAVTRKLAALINKKMKNVNVVLTRDDDTFVSLQERANIANRNKGDLFISIHTNSVDKSNPNRTKVSGASVYALGPQKDANNLKVAQRENSVIELESNYHQKYSGFDPSKDESYIIFEMAQKKTLGQSLRFADQAQKEMVKTAGRADRGVKQAGFWVLWATSMPAVLVELDFICNPKEAEYLSSASGQDELATALFNAVKSYVENQKATASNPNSDADVRIAQPETDIYAENLIADSDPTQSVGLLSPVSSSQKSERNPHIASANAPKRTNGPRRRRSSSSKAMSDKQNFETQAIRLKSESDYMIRQETEENLSAQTKKEEATVEKSKKNKGRKQKEKQVKRADATRKESASAKNSNTKKTSSKTHSNQKTFVVSSSKAPAALPASETKASSKDNEATAKNTRKTASAGRPVYVPRQNTSSSQMVYKIQLLASDHELSSNDAAFCGLKPSGVFKENGQFKYTYGSSTNRRDIEQQLLNIKSVLPDAIIIVRNE